MSMRRAIRAVAAALLLRLSLGECPNYSSHSQQHHEPLSTGAYGLSYQRPDPACRTYNSSGVEEIIVRLKDKIYDPDLSRLFENTFPNTLDTAIRWRGKAANNTEEELCFVITGDIDAMWIRDSADQIAPYKSALHNATDDIASVFRGVLNLQARYLVISPYCNAFHPPPRAACKCKSTRTPFLQMGHDYYKATGDVGFFGKFQWIYAIQSIMSASNALKQPTYGPDGVWVKPEYTFQSETNTGAGTLGNHGIGNPVNYTGLLRSPFRPSDDSATYDFSIPANMMMAVYLESNANIMERLPNAPTGLAKEMRDMAAEIREAIKTWGTVKAPNGKKVFAYEVDGYGGQNLMDDANVPSLLSAPFLGFLDMKDEIYQNTRSLILGRSNPFWCQGPVISGIGSPHVQPGATWPMSVIMRIMTTDSDIEIRTNMKMILSSTDGLGLIHESINAADASRWTRQWFTWANGLFGQMILDIEARKPHLLQESYQPFRYMAAV
ncbi:hypothetical protein PG996_014904 [Apiospora saccharicola]|uniref:Glycoside hydrolase family 125 protein n=1 Tax=Apiospora saccharicola TaxID=335842 RepID=A0ABR1TJM1_9PEZI